MNIFNLLPYDINSSRLYENTFNKALYNLASKYYLGYEAPHIITLDHLQNFTFETPKIDGSLVFIAEHPNYNSKTEEIIRKDCPNAKIIVITTDSIYYSIDAISKMNVSLYLTTLSSELEGLRKKGPADFFWWTLSEDIIEDVKKIPEQEKQFIGICLCNNSFYRNQFFNKIQQLTGYPVIWGINEYDINKIYKLYKKSYFGISITGTAPGFGDTGGYRSMKGLRDALSICCGAMLVSDGHPDMEKFNFPTYEYNNPESCANLLYIYGQDPDLRNEELKRQQKLLSTLSMELQLEKILLKYNLL
jgi:hypothetical protein